MIVICEECGKKYRIDPEKISGQEAKFKCKSCSHEIVVQKPEGKPAAAPIEQEAVTPPSVAAGPAPVAAPAKERRPLLSQKRIKLGVRGKMILLFFVLPVLISGLAAFYTMMQISLTADQIVQASETSIRHMAELSLIAESKGIADEISAIVADEPDLTVQNAASHPKFRDIVERTFPWGGAVSLYALPDASGTWKTVVHKDPALTGSDLQVMEVSMGEDFQEFWNLATAVEDTAVSRGYITVKEPSGNNRELYMVSRRIGNTSFALALTTPADQMMRSASQLQQVADDRVDVARFITISVMMLAFLLIGIVVTTYGHRLAGRIKDLTEASDKISVGDLDTEITVKSNDEIGELAEAIARMQDSLRLSIQRLRRRR
ncbi:MAG: HAMP domain-containing protein [Desulfovibrionales bacterium]